jgi:MerR family transcriptional regulator, redox-sensitive transcriptional activator SoxR
VRFKSSTSEENEMAGWSIGDVASQAGLRPSAIRYYERLGVLPPAARASGRRRYGAEVLQRLAVIDVAQRAGFTLGEIRTLCAGIGGRRPSARWRQMAERKLVEVEALLERVREMQRLLEAGLECGCIDLRDCRLLRTEAARRIGEPVTQRGVRRSRRARPTRSAAER